MTNRRRHLVPSLLLAMVACAAPARAQLTSGTSPVFLQDSQRAADALPRALELASSELYDEASRVLHELALSDGGLLLELPSDPALLVPVRRRIHDALRSDDALLARYRELYGPMARAALNAGESGRVERDMLLTEAGIDAALLVARDHLEHARFHAAWRTLAQLDRHPDFGARTERCAEMLSDVWSYLDAQGQTDALDPGSDEMLRRWRRAASMPARPEAPAETPIFPRVRTLFDDPGDIRVEGVLSQPLISRSTGQPAQIVTLTATTDSSIPREARVLQGAPVLVGDVIYANTTDRIGAWNRFTGQELWSTTIESPARTRINRYSGNNVAMEEVATLVAGDGLLVALTGTAVQGTYSERLLVALDPETGEIRWRLALSESLDERLTSAVFDGPPVLVEGVVVVGAIEHDVARRTVTRHLVGVDASDGAILWSRPLTSVGSLPYQRTRTPAEGLTSRGADVIRVSPLGAIACIEAATGRVRWVRREVVDQSGPRIASGPETWRFHTPVVTGDRLYTLAPDRREILEMRASTGEVLRRANARSWKDPYDLLLVNGALVGVSDTEVVYAPLERFDDVERYGRLVKVSGRDGTPIRGRAVRAGDRLFLPLVEGLAWIRINDASEDPERALIPLDASGNALLLDGQMIVQDDTRVHTYFAWEVARELLAEREAQDPTDPGAPITYAQLAYRAGEVDEIGGALDRALHALALDPLRAGFDGHRRTMFDAVLAMARPDRDPSRLARLTPTLRRNLLERLAQLAVTPEERVSSLMTAGAYFEAINDPPRAVERYQRLLADPALHRVPFEYAGIRTPAAEEVARRLTTLVAAAGREVYAPYDELAGRRLGALGEDAGRRTMLDLARAFPVATVTPELYLTIGERARQRGDARDAIDAYEAGLRAILPGEQPELAGELAGRAVVEATRSGRLATALLRLREIHTLVPGAVLTYEGRALDDGRLLDEIVTLQRFAQRRPRIDSAITPEPDILPGLRVQRPVVRSGVHEPTDTVAFRAPDSDELSFWGVDDNGVLRERWGGLVGHDLLHVEGDSVYTSTLPDIEPGRRVLHCFDANTGRERWESVAFEDVFDPDITPRFAPPERDETILDRVQEARELVIAVGDQAFIVAERAGRVVAISKRTGAIMWADRLPVSRVLDIDAGSGAVAIIGLRRRTLEELRRARHEPPRIEERLVVLDERDGSTLHDPSLSRLAQWVRVTPEGALLVGCEGGVMQFALRSGRLMGDVDIPDLADSLGVEVFPGRAFVLSSLGVVIAIDTTSGRLERRRIETADRISLKSASLGARQIGDLVYLSSRLGFIAVDSDLNLVTADTRPPGVTALLPEFTERYAVVMGTSGESSFDSRFATFALSVHDLETGRLLEDPIPLPFPVIPDTIKVIDGHVLITAAGSTVILHAPPERGFVRPEDPTFDVNRVYAPEPIEQTAPTPETPPEAVPDPEASAPDSP